jgi:hypothetical protein
MVDRGEPEVSRSEWHGDGTAGEHNRASHLIVEAQARPRVRPVQGDAGLVGKSSKTARQLIFVAAR